MCAQKSQIVANIVRNLPFDTLNGKKSIQWLVLLEVEPGQAKDGLVAHLLFNIALDDCRDGASGTKVHAVGQFEITYGKFGVVDMVIESVALRFIKPVVLHQLGVEPGDGIKPFPLKAVVQGFSEIKVFQFLGSRRSGRR